MKKHCIQLAFLFLVLLIIQEHGENARISAQEDGYITTSGVQFVLNGNPFYINGFNAYWLMFLGSDPYQKTKVSTAFREAEFHGLSIARIWAFSDGGASSSSTLQYSPGLYNENMFQGLDFVISEARKYGVRLILSLVNNFDDFGGKKQYVEWGRSKGQSMESDDDFFTNEVVKGFYKNHIKAVLTRRNSITGTVYKDDPTIMAWELMNEPRCAKDLSGKTIQAWISEMASFLKSIDTKHLLEAGLEGFYGSDPQKQKINPKSQLFGTDFIGNNQISDIDFATVHSYPDAWLSSQSTEAQISFLSSWLNSHIQDAERIIGKPVLLAEFGRSSKDHNVISLDQRDREFEAVYSAIYASASGGGAAAGGLFWQFLTRGMEIFRDGYEVIFSESPSTTAIIVEQSKKLGEINDMWWYNSRDFV